MAATELNDFMRQYKQKNKSTGVITSQFITAKEYAERTGLKEATVRLHCRNGYYGDRAKQDGRTWYIDMGEEMDNDLRFENEQLKIENTRLKAKMNMVITLLNNLQEEAK